MVWHISSSPTAWYLNQPLPGRRWRFLRASRSKPTQRHRPKGKFLKETGASARRRYLTLNDLRNHGTNNTINHWGWICLRMGVYLGHHIDRPRIGWKLNFTSRSLPPSAFYLITSIESVEALLLICKKPTWDAEKCGFHVASVNHVPSNFQQTPIELPSNFQQTSIKVPSNFH